MDKKEIALAVGRYLVNNSKDLKGMLNGNNYFNMGGATRDSGDSYHELCYGHAADILAKCIENKDFFGDWISDVPDQATNSNNAKLIPIKQTKDGLSILVKNFTETKDGLLVKVPLTPSKAYLSTLKNYSEFKRYSEFVDLSSDFGKRKSKVQISKSIDELFGKK